MQDIYYPTIAAGREIYPFGYINRRLYPFTDGKHMGVDIVAPLKSEIRAVLSGTVIESGWMIKGGYGRRVVIDHGDFLTLYGHLRPPLMAQGGTVEPGQVIGLMGGDKADSYRGASSGVHLHFEVLLKSKPENINYIKTYKGYAVDPIKWLENAYLKQEAKYIGTVITGGGVKTRSMPEVSSRAAKLGALVYGKKYLFVDSVDDPDNRATWYKLLSLKYKERAEWSAARYAGTPLIDIESLSSQVGDGSIDFDLAKLSDLTDAADIAAKNIGARLAELEQIIENQKKML